MTASTAENEGLEHLAGASIEWLRILEINPDAILVLGDDERIAFANRAAARLLGVSREALVGRRLDPVDWRMTTPAGVVLTGDSSPFRRVLRDGVSVQDLEIVITRPDGARVQLAVNAAVLGRGSVSRRSLIASIRDVTERRRMETHSALLAEAGRVLAGTLEVEQMMRSLAALVVPAFGDWSVLDVLEADGVHRFAVTRNDGSAQVRHAVVRYPLAEPASSVVRERVAMLVRELSPAALEQHVRDADRIAELRTMGARSLLVVPLLARGRVEGALTFV
ncbi:MAG: PAS domain-containing protein, partial [Longimicrobiales bacterium]